MSNNLPNSLQRLIRNILDNDAQIKKVKHMETPVARTRYEHAEEPKRKSKKHVKFDNVDDVEDIEDVDEDIPIEKPKAKRVTRKERNNNLSHQYMEEVALGNLKYKDANGKNRTTTYKQWVSKNKSPKYDEANECWSIPDPDMYGPRALAQKTVGSLFMKTSKCKLAEMQGAVTDFLNEINDDEHLAEILQTPHIAEKALDIMTDWYEEYKSVKHK